MLRERITRMPLKDGDVLLIQGRPEDVDRLRGERDVVLMEWSRQPLVTPQHRRVATGIFLSAAAASAFALVPIALGAFLGHRTCGGCGKGGPGSVHAGGRSILQKHSNI